MSWVLVIALILCLGVVGIHGAPAKTAAPSSDNKVKQIAELAGKSRGNVITLDDSTFNHYAISRPRPYSLVVFLTAAHPKFKCNICKQIDSEMSVVAQAYMKATKPEDQNVFFVRLDYEAASKTFQSFGVQSVPVVFHIPASVSGDKSSRDYVINARDKYSIPANPDAESIANFLRDRAGVSVEIKRSMIWAYVSMIVVFAVLGLLVKPIMNMLPTILLLVRNRVLWAVISIGIYTCAISGLIFDIIRSPQMYYANPQTGQIMFFYPQSGNQFVVEGFVIGFLNVACAMALVAVAVFFPKIKDDQKRTLSMLAGIFVFIFCFRWVRSLYIMKNNWYGKAY